MNELVSSNITDITEPSPARDSVLSMLSHSDSKTLLILSGMLCLTAIICVGCVSFSGSEMTLSKNGLSITQPRVET